MVDGRPTPDPRGRGPSWRGATLFGAALAAAHVALLGSLRLYPFVDVPNHLAAATIFRYSGQAGNAFDAFYTVPSLFKPNVIHLAFCGVPLLPTIEIANTVFFCLYALLVPLGVLVALRVLGGNPWYGLLSFLTLYNFSVGWGLVGYVASIPLTVVLFLVLLRHFDRPGPWSSAATGVLLALFFLVHAQATLFALLLFFAMAVARFRVDVPRTIRHLLLAAPTVAIFAAWWVLDWARSEPSGDSLGTFEALKAYYLHDYLRSLPHRLSPLFLADNTFLGKSPVYLAIEAALFLVIAVPAAIGLGRLLRGGADEGRWKRLEGPLVLLACSAACYFLLPEDLPGHQFVSQRFAVLVLIALVLVAGVLAEPRMRRLQVGVIVTAAAFHLALWSGYFLAFQKENAGFDRAFLPDPAHGPMAALIYERRFRDQPVYIHFPNYQIVWNRGIATTKLVDFRFGVVRRRVGEDVLPIYHDWVGPEDPYLGWYSGIDAILVRGTVPAADAAHLEGYRIASRAGAWALYERARGGPSRP